MIRRLFVACVGFGFLLAAGCGPSEAPRAEVTGKISYKGKPLTVGSVNFIGGNIVASGTIESGQYKVADAPVGDVQISVLTPASTAAPMQMKQKVEGKSFTGTNVEVVPVPPALNDPATSGLKYTVKAESPQTYDIAIP